MARIMLDAGHYGKYNRSPAVPTYYESDMAWKLHNKLKAELESYGIEVAVTRTSQAKDLEVYSRGTKARGYDMFISLHSNAVGSAVRNDVDRPVVIRLASDNKDGEVLGRKFADMMHDVMGTKQAGQVTTRLQGNGAEYYGVLRGAKAVGCPHAFIVEHSFHTATAPSQWLLVDSNLDILAKREAEIIANYFGLKKAQKEQKEQEDEPMTAAEKKYVESLEKRIKELEDDNKVYHYYKELPEYARATITALHRDGVFAGASAGDIKLPHETMRLLLINARAGLYGEKYKNL